MTQVIFETARLRVRRWETFDLPVLAAVYGDAGAMRWVGDGSPITESECREWLAVTHRNYRTRGYGMFAADRKDTAETIGFCGIVHPGAQVEPEIKYAYARSFWGRGFATEAAIGLLDHAHRGFGLPQVIATTAPENLASHRVLLKAGFERAELRDSGDGACTQVFRWTATGPDRALALHLR